MIADKRVTAFVRRPNCDQIMRNVNPLGLVYAACISNERTHSAFHRTRERLQRPSQIDISKRKATANEFSIASRVLNADGIVEAPTLSGDEKPIYFHKKVHG